MNDPNRRVFVKTGVGIAIGSLAISTTGCTDANMLDRKLVFTSLNQAMAETDRLSGIADLKSDAVWSLPNTLIHLAQSIEYSVSGFPEAKSALFQNTVGAAAFKVFSWRGRMSHGLDEPIPGAPKLEEIDLNSAMLRLRKAVESFSGAVESSLKAHFAYGSLSKAQYEHAHAMHIANHLSVIQA